MSYPFHVRSVLLAATGMSLDDNGHPPLPVELVEQILSYCDRHALLSCGAVCQTWLIITRPRIFGTLRVTRESSEPLSTLIGSPYSTPSTYTKSLYITYSTHATRNVELRWLEDLADKLLLFKQMYHLELNLPNAPSLDLRSITKALETLSPRVTSLSLRGSFDLEMQNIIPMVSACGSLRRLKLTQEGSYTRWSGLRSPLPSTLPMPQTIEHIQLELKSISMASSWMTWMQNNPKPRTPASFSTTTYAIGMQSVSEYLAKPTTASMVHLRLVSHPMSSGMCSIPLHSSILIDIRILRTFRSVSPPESRNPHFEPLWIPFCGGFAHNTIDRYPSVLVTKTTPHQCWSVQTRAERECPTCIERIRDAGLLSGEPRSAHDGTSGGRGQCTLPTSSMGCRTPRVCVATELQGLVRVRELFFKMAHMSFIKVGYTKTMYDFGQSSFGWL